MTRLRGALRSWPRIGDFLAAAWFAALGLLLLRSAFFGGEVLSSTNTLYTSVPFAASAPDGWQEDANPLLADVPYFFTPMLDLVRESFRSGELPLWNPYIMGGAPLLGDAQSAPLSPVNTPAWILPWPDGLAAVALLKIWLAGFGTYLFCRSLGLSRSSAALGGTAFGLCAFQVGWLGHAHTNVTSILPWAMWAVERMLQDRTIGATALLAIGVGALGVGGHPESIAISLLGILVYSLGRLAQVDQRAYRRDGVLRLVCGILVGLALAGAALLPFLEALEGSADSLAQTGDVGTLPGEALLTILFPDWWGRPTGPHVEAPANFNERTYYAGVGTVLLGLIAVLTPGAGRRYAPLVGLGLLGLLGSSSTTTLSGSLRDLPVLEQSAVARLHVLWALAVSTLAGVGLEQLVARRVPRAVVVGVTGGGLIVTLVAVAWIGPSPAEILDVARDLPGGVGVSEASSLHLGAVLWSLLLLALFVLAVTAHARSARMHRAFAPVLLAIAAFDMIAFADGYQPTVPESQFYRPVPGSLRQIADGDDPHYRATALFSHFPSNVGQVFRIRDVRAKEFPKPVEMVLLFRRLFNERQDPLAELGVANTSGPATAALGMMSVRYVLTGPDENALDPRWYSRVYQAADGIVYNNRLAAPRARVPQQVELAARSSMLDLIASGRFDPRKQAMIEPGPGVRAVRGVKGEARILRETGSRVEIAATLDREGFVILADTAAPGWGVKVDGKPAAPLLANYVQRAVQVPAGDHRIVWEYDPSGVRWGLRVTVGAGLLTFGLVILVWWRRRSAPTQ